jgi:hypothetical protein
MVRLRRRKRGSSAFSVIPSVREGTLLLQESTEEMRRPLEKWTACPSFQAKVIPALCWIISDWLRSQAKRAANPSNLAHKEAMHTQIGVGFRAFW